MTRALGILLVGAGVVVLGHVGVTYVEGALAADRARAQWEALVARRATLAARAQAGVAEATLPYRGSPVARLWIPRIELDEIIVEGVGNSELNAGPGHLPGSPLPGERGNSIVSAHRDRHFRQLGDVAIGDTIVTESLHDRVVWVVSTRKLVPAGAPALFSSEEPRLTLTTCWPLRYLGSAPDRLLITAVPLARLPRA